MLRPNQLGIAVLACWAALGATNLCQAQERREERAGAPPATGRDVRVKSILGTQVSLGGDYAVGTIDDIVFSDDGYVEYLIVQREGRYVPVPWSAAKFDFARRTATLDITRDRFREVPTFTTDQWTTIYEPSYRDKVYTYYGVRPRPALERSGVERRIERRERP